MWNLIEDYPDVTTSQSSRGSRGSRCAPPAGVPGAAPPSRNGTRLYEYPDFTNLIDFIESLG